MPYTLLASHSIVYTIHFSVVKVIRVPMLLVLAVPLRLVLKSKLRVHRWRTFKESEVLHFSISFCFFQSFALCNYSLQRSPLHSICYHCRTVEDTLPVSCIKPLVMPCSLDCGHSGWMCLVFSYLGLGSGSS